FFNRCHTPASLPHRHAQDQEPWSAMRDAKPAVPSPTIIMDKPPFRPERGTELLRGPEGLIDKNEALAVTQSGTCGDDGAWRASCAPRASSGGSRATHDTRSHHGPRPSTSRPRSR